MNKLLKNLTIVIVTYKTDFNILFNCISSINKNIKIKIIENSKKFEKKDFVKKNFPNIEITCTGKNLGMGSGNNFGLKLVKTRYALVLNPDTECSKDFFKILSKYLNPKDNDFSIIGANYKDSKSHLAGGFFEENLHKKVIKNKKNRFLKEVDWVIGCTMLVDLYKFKKKKLFDENFFLFYEEFDLCRQVKLNGGKVYLSNELIIKHLGFKGSFAVENKFKLKAIMIRNWHWMWSVFYFHKKNYGYFSAFRKTIGKLLRSFVKIIYYSLIFNQNEKIKYLYRFLGLLNSMIGRKAYFRVFE